MDYNEVQVNDESWVFENYTQVQGLLTNVYSYIDYDFGFDAGFNGAMLSSATDESDFASSFSYIHRYYNGSWNSVNAFSETWTNSYTAIYQANSFLEKLDKVFETLEEYRYNELVNTYEMLLAKFELFPYEARFLRAYFHFELAKTYGDIPLVTKTLSPEEANTVVRTPVQDVFKFIVDECDAIVEYLPITHATEKDPQMGRINRPTVLGLKARALLYAASPLHSPANPKEAWRRAAEASKQLIDIASDWGITFSTSYKQLWGENNHYSNPEIFFIRRVNTSRQFELYNYPIGHENAVTGGNCPTQNLVDSYEFSNDAPPELRGKTFGQAWDEGVLPSPPNQYLNLDPRFAFTVAKNDDKWPEELPYSELPLQIFTGGRNGTPLLNSTPTGYYLKKYVDGSTNITTANANTRRHSWIIYRLAEFYLNYAEAMFHYMDGDATASSDGILNMSANDAINVLRNRPDIKMPIFGSETTGPVWEERYMRERMVELAFEGHRFWDVRRWKKGEDFFKEIKTIKVATDDGSISRGQSINRLWYDRYYLYPIPYGEIIKAPTLKQNHGWGIE